MTNQSDGSVACAAEPPVSVCRSPGDAQGARAPVPGVLNISKPAGWTSHDVVASLRRVLGTKKIGHAGTLDPAATGVLPILVGKATKIAEHLLNWDKEYRAVLRLGQSTDTQDATGTVLRTIATNHLSEEGIRSTIGTFLGDIQQVPPMYSAVKVAGRPLYTLARRGEEIERRARTVTIQALDVLAIRGDDVDLRVVCSKGTYIRTLCADIGEQLGVGGHLHWLERSRVGPCRIEQAVPVEDLPAVLGTPRWREAMLTIDGALAQYPAVTIRLEDERRVLNGVSLRIADVATPPSHVCRDGAFVRVRTQDGRLLALGTVAIENGAQEEGRHGNIMIHTLCVDRESSTTRAKGGV